MEQEQHSFDIKGIWQGTLTNGSGQFKGEHLSLTQTLPKNFGGMQEGTNPEELFAATASGCFLLMVAGILQSQAIDFEKIEIYTKASYQLNKRLPQLKTLVHRIRILQSNPSEHAQLLALVKKAEQGCMVNQAIRNNVAVTIELET